MQLEQQMITFNRIISNRFEEDNLFKKSKGVNFKQDKFSSNPKYLRYYNEWERILDIFHHREKYPSISNLDYFHFFMYTSWTIATKQMGKFSSFRYSYNLIVFFSLFLRISSPNLSVPPLQTILPYLAFPNHNTLKNDEKLKRKNFTTRKNSSTRKKIAQRMTIIFLNQLENVSKINVIKVLHTNGETIIFVLTCELHTIRFPFATWCQL